MNIVRRMFIHTNVSYSPLNCLLLIVGRCNLW